MSIVQFDKYEVDLQLTVRVLDTSYDCIRSFSNSLAAVFSSCGHQNEVLQSTTFRKLLLLGRGGAKNVPTFLEYSVSALTEVETSTRRELFYILYCFVI